MAPIEAVVGDVGVWKSSGFNGVVCGDWQWIGRFVVGCATSNLAARSARGRKNTYGSINYILLTNLYF